MSARDNGATGTVKNSLESVLPATSAPPQRSGARARSVRGGLNSEESISNLISPPPPPSEQPPPPIKDEEKNSSRPSMSQQRRQRSQRRKTCDEDETDGERYSTERDEDSTVDEGNANRVRDKKEGARGQRHSRSPKSSSSQRSRAITTTTNQSKQLSPQEQIEKTQQAQLRKEPPQEKPQREQPTRALRRNRALYSAPPRACLERRQQQELML